MSAPTTDLTPWEARELRRIAAASGAVLSPDWNLIRRGHRSLERAGLIEINGSQLRLTPEGRKVASTIVTHCHDCGITYDDGRAACPRCGSRTTTKGPDGEEPE